ncbi:hypothetical protein [Phocaeicola coprocola]|uniref:hypothetical protein n=1 Tax=Phocaeicola coprocola TaxID=310298 RepID=UPI003FD778A8
MEDFWNMQWPVSVFLFVFVISVFCFVAYFLFLRHQRWMKCQECNVVKKEKEEEEVRKKLRDERMEEQAITKRIEELEKQTKFLTDEKIGKHSQNINQQDLDRIAFMMYALANKKDSSLDMEKLSKEIESFKSIYKDLEKYLKTNQ